MAYKICPICASPSPKTAAACSVCGASLTAVAAAGERPDSGEQPADYDDRYGETDLDEGSLKWRGATYILLIIALVTGVVCVSAALLAGARLAELAGGPTLPPTVDRTLLVTNTARPTMFLPTVTDAPPTQPPSPSPAPTDTPGPCIQQVQPGDSLIAIVGRCGHRNLAVIDLVLELNNLSAPEVIQSGQTLEIPWPTPTDDPASAVTETPEGETNAAGQSPVVIGAPLPGSDTLAQLAAAPPTATLQPGVAWHRVATGENIIVVAYAYGANVKILSELNPEVTFSQCDFGLETGGPNCVVQIYEGQLLRVPAPTPTPTLSPTPSGSETATPTATPTFNAPSALSPGDGRLFQRDEFVTLRWIASGTLAPGQVYRVRVTDITAGAIYEADTAELSFVLPLEWQGRDQRRHEYRWTVSVIASDSPQRPYFTTEPRTFLWEAQGESS